MLKIKTNPKTLVFFVLAGITAGTVLDGCTSTQNSATTQSDVATTQPSFALWGPPPKKSGVELWSDNCARCHNLRAPDQFSAAQWEVLVHHMRTRANLTGEESREIVKFLQASS